MYDLGIIGNGIVGVVSAIRLSKLYPNFKIALVGTRGRTHSASMAAGAMLNVYGEIDYDYGADKYTDLKIEMGNSSVQKWKRFIKKYELDELYCADQTVIFSPVDVKGLEDRCFKAIYSRVLKDGRLVESKNLNDTSEYFNSLNKDFKYFGIQDEGAIDIKRFFQWADKELQSSKNITVIHASISHLDFDHNVSKYILKTKSDNISCAKYLVCAGTFNDVVLKGFKGILPSIHGVGTAIEITNDHGMYQKLPDHTVFRTPNRGGTCGLHLVPRNKNRINPSYYVGAGSSISREWPEAARFGTVEYLINSFQNQLRPLDRDLSLANIKILQGSRPVSFDGKPIIGPLENHNEIFVIGGTKRDGLTLVFELVQQVENWLNNKDIDYEAFRPNRAPISFWDQKFATEIYAENKLTGLIEHKTMNGKSEERLYKELLEEAEIFYQKIYKKYPMFKDKGIHPELLNVIHE